MASNNNNSRYDYQMLALALALPFMFLSDEQIQTEFISNIESIIEKYENSGFFKDMSDYLNTFTSENYQCNYFSKL